MKRISPKLAAWGLAVVVCTGSALTYAKLTKSHTVRTRPMLVVQASDDSYDFFAFADVSTVGIGLQACAEEFGEEQFLEIFNGTASGDDYAFAFVKPELGFSCPLSELPGGVKLIRVMGHCPDGTFELTSFDGTTVTPELGKTYLVADTIIVPEGCHDVLTHSVAFEIEHAEPDVFPGPYPHQEP